LLPQPDEKQGKETTTMHVRHLRVLLLGAGVLVVLALALFSLRAPRTLAQPPVPADPTAFEQPLDARIFRVHDLTNAAPVVNAAFPVDGGSWLTFNVGAASNSLAITLTSPTGQVFTTSDAVIIPELNDPNAEGHNYTFDIATPAPGLWSYEIRENGAIAVTRTALVDVLSDSSLRAGFVNREATVPVGAPVVLGLITAEGATVRNNGLTIAATLTRLDDPAAPTTSLDLRDAGTAGDAGAGDGLFSALVQPEAPGEYYVEATISGTTTGGRPFLRTASSFFVAAPLRATLTGAFSDRGIDDDGDGAFDRVGVTPALSVAVAGEYSILVTLESSTGTTISANVIQPLDTGATGVEVSFPVADLREILAVDGPYLVKQVLIEYITADAVELAAERFDLGSTAAYQLEQLTGTPISLGSGGSAVGVDTDGDGRFEVLEVRLPISVQVADFYIWEAGLKDGDGTVIVRASDSGSLAAGDGTITLRFDGSAIGASGLDGPYLVADLFIYSGGGQSLLVSTAFTTEAFQAAQFVGGAVAPIAVAGGPYVAEVGASVTLDGSGSSDPDGTIATYAWDFESDGVFDVESADPTAAYTITAALPLTATLRVTDADGLSATATALIGVRWNESLEWYGGTGTMSGVRRVASYVRDQTTCDTDPGYEHAFSFDVPSPINPARLTWWALDVTTDQGLQQRYGNTLLGKGEYSAANTVIICMDDIGPLPGGVSNVQQQLRLSWTAP